LFFMNVRDSLFDTLFALFSFWRSLHLDRVTFIPFLAYSQESWRQQPSQPCVPP
jgi:hypothetical protein